MLWLVLGMAAILAGIVVLVLGSIFGVLLLLVGVGVMAYTYKTMMRGSGYDPDQGTINGLNGQGKQQSEAVKTAQPAIGEQPADIWDQVSKEKKQ